MPHPSTRTRPVLAAAASALLLVIPACSSNGSDPQVPESSPGSATPSASPQGSSGAGSADQDFGDLGQFTQLQADAAVQVTVTLGDSRSVAITGGDKERAVVSAEGDTLELSAKPDTGTVEKGISVAVTVPELTDIDASQAASVSVEGTLTGDSIEITASQAASITAELDIAGKTDIDLTGASSAALSGKTSSLAAEADGASTLKAADLVAGDAVVTASGASSAAVNVTGALQATAESASNVTYSGNPSSVDKKESGAGSVSPAD